MAQTARGNARILTCGYHRWRFDSKGRNRNITWQKAGCDADAFQAEDRDLARLPVFADYRGFLIGGRSADVPHLATHLNDAAKRLDLIADQSTEGVELVPGAVTFNAARRRRHSRGARLRNQSHAGYFEPSRRQS